MKRILAGKRFYWIVGALVIANVGVAILNLTRNDPPDRSAGRSAPPNAERIRPVAGGSAASRKAAAPEEEKMVHLPWKMGQIQCRLGPSRADNLLVPVKVGYRLAMALERLGTADEQKQTPALTREIQQMLLAELRRGKTPGLQLGPGPVQYRMDPGALASVRQRIASRLAASFPPEKAEALLSWTLGAYGTADARSDFSVAVLPQADSPMHKLTVESGGSMLYSAPVDPASPGDWAEFMPRLF